MTRSHRADDARGGAWRALLLALTLGLFVTAPVAAPIFVESGVDLTLVLWRGIAVPKGTPGAAIQRLERAFTGAAQMADFRDFATRMGAVVEIRGARAFDEFIAQQDRELAALMEQIGLRKP